MYFVTHFSFCHSFLVPAIGPYMVAQLAFIRRKRVKTAQHRKRKAIYTGEGRVRQCYSNTLLPHCFHSASTLLPHCFHSASTLLPLCFHSASTLLISLIKSKHQTVVKTYLTIKDATS